MCVAARTGAPQNVADTHPDRGVPMFFLIRRLIRMLKQRKRTTS